MLKKSLAMLLSVLMVLSVTPVMGVSAADGDEMLLDPGMEQIAAGWEDRHAGTGDKITYVTNEYHSGEKSIKAVNGSEFQTTSYEFDPSKGYKFSIWVKGTGRYWIGVPCFDENGTALGTWSNWTDVYRGSSYIESGNITHSDWTQLTIGISEGGIVPPGTKYFRVHIRTLSQNNGGSAAELYFDDASLTAYDNTDDVIKYDGLVNPNPGMSSMHWWTLTKSAEDYTTYHSAPVSIKAQYDSTVFEIAKEKQNAYNLDANKHYELSVWAKTDNSTDAELRLFMNTEWAFKTIVSFSPTTEWKQYKGYFKGADVANASGSMGSSRKVGVQARDGGVLGNIWIDDITLREVIIPGSILLSGDESINLPDFGSKDTAYTANVNDVNGTPMANVDLKWEVVSDYPEDITISESGVLTVSDKVLPSKTAVVKVSSVEFPDVKAEKTVTFTYQVTDEFKAQLQSLLKQGDETTVAFLAATETKKPLTELGVRIEDFISSIFSDTDRTAVVTAVKAEATDVLEENITLLNEKIFIQLVNAADAATVEAVLLAYDEEKALGLADNDIYALLCEEGRETAKAAAMTRIAEKTFTTSTGLKPDVDEILATSYFSYLTAGQIESALALVAEKTGLSTDSKYNTYKGLTSTNSKKIAINKAMVSVYNTYTDIYNKFISAYDNAPSGGGGGGGGGGSTGGGGGSGSSNKGESTIVVPYEPIISKPSVQITPNETPAQPEKFSDMKAAEWAKEAVVALSEKGIINGYTDGTFKPGNKVTREEFLKMLLSAVGLVKDDAECDFSDVDKNEWYYKYIAAAAENGIAQGINETAFGVGENITREQMAAFAMRAMEAVKLAEDATEADDSTFADDAEISEYAKTAVYQMKKLGIINGFPDGSFKPQEGATRAEAAVVIYAIFNLK